jgi:hypothetical protein
MSDETAQDLRDAASEAHYGGDIEAAVLLYQFILDRHPESTEAVEAMFYLTSIGRGPRQTAKRLHVHEPQPATPSKPRVGTVP